MQPRVIATCFSLTAFAASIIIGAYWASNPTATVLWRALLVMIVSYPVGLVVGMFLFRVVQDHIDEHRRAHPMEEQVGHGPEGRDDDSSQDMSPRESHPQNPAGAEETAAGRAA